MMKDRFNRYMRPGQVAAIAGGIALAFTATPSAAFTIGGLAKAQGYASDIQAGIYALVGVLALIYLIYLGIMAFTEKKSWADFGWGVVHVSLVGGAVSLGTWAWSLFSS